jgi:hypothetical protein
VSGTITQFTGPSSGGLVPGGLTGQQLSYITRRAIIPTVFVQVYQAHPLLSLLLSNTQAAMGGVGQITFPVQGSSFVSFQWGGFAGDFQIPQDQVALNQAQFNLKAGMVPIGFFGFESIIQSSEVVIPKLRAVTSDAAVVMKQSLATSLYSYVPNNSPPGNLALDSLVGAYDNGTNAPTYGGINRTGANSYWQGQYYPNSATIANRLGVAEAIVKVQTGSGGEAPDFIVMNPVNWAALMADFISSELYNTDPKSKYGRGDFVNSGFRALRVLDVPVFADMFCPVGEMYMINSRYLAMFMHPSLQMYFTGFESMIPQGQLASIGVLVVALNMCCMKPSSGAHFTGITNPAWSGGPPPPPYPASQTAFNGQPLN